VVEMGGGEWRRGRWLIDAGMEMRVGARAGWAGSNTSERWRANSAAEAERSCAWAEEIDAQCWNKRPATYSMPSPANAARLGALAKDTQAASCMATPASSGNVCHPGGRPGAKHPQSL
jgi:cation diffusion facilitator CzcD-associated flavoprotein CzcO